MKPRQVQWVKSVGGDFLDLLRLDLKSSYFLTPKKGVYVIWYTSVGKAPVIKVGQGNIQERLGIERISPQINPYSNIGQLKVSWIVLNDVNQQTLDGIEVYLYDYYKPLVGERKAVTQSIPVIPLLSL